MNPTPSAFDAQSDEQLAACAAGGSMICVDILVRRYQVPLLRYVMARGCGRHQAEDVVQDSFLKMFRAIDRFDPNASFKPWIFTIVQRSLIDAARVDASRRRTSISISDRDPLSAPNSETDPAMSAARDESNERLWTIARRVLSEEQFAVIWLFYVESLTTAEIAGVQNRSWAWVRTALTRGRRALMPHLESVHSNRIAEGVA